MPALVYRPILHISLSTQRVEDREKKIKRADRCKSYYFWRRTCHRRINSETHREAIARRAQRSLCLNLANCRNTRTNYHLTSQQSVPFFIPALSRLCLPSLFPKWIRLFDLLQSRRSMSPREFVHRRSNPPIFFSLYTPPFFLSLSFFLRFDSSKILRWSTVQNGPMSIIPRFMGAIVLFIQGALLETIQDTRRRW